MGKDKGWLMQKNTDPLKQWEQNNGFSVIGDGHSIFSVNKTTMEKGIYVGQEIDQGGFKLRLFAHLVDSFLLYIVIIGTTLIGINKSGWIGLLLMIAYYTFLEGSSKQATLGKMLFGLRIISVDGEKAQWPQALARAGLMIGIPTLIVQTAVWIYPFLPLRAYTYIRAFVLAFDCMFILSTQKNQAIHDILAKCMVIQVPKTVPIKQETPEQSEAKQLLDRI